MSLVVVSNRVARGNPNEPITGGLAAALLPIVEESGAIWVGATARHSDPVAASVQEADARRRQPNVQALGKGELMTLDLPGEHYGGYYEGFANSVLWPAFHSFGDLVSFSQHDYDSYRVINELMARSLLKFSERDAFWVHDYHFLLLGARLRELGVNQPIGFFLHTPWPEPLVMRSVPPHRDLIWSMLAYDLIGFQTERDRQNFLACIDDKIGVTTEDGHVISRHGRTRCQVFPIGIDAERFAKYAEESISQPYVSSLPRGLNGKKLAIGVDRLDYTKGIDKRIHEFAHLWTKEPRSISLLQIANPSRGSIKAYRNLRNYIAGLVSDANSEHRNVNWTPMRYLNSSFSQAVLAGLYRTAEVGVVTPLSDGMNLVAKEYVAAQDRNDPGVLVLSKFAGAAQELHGALLIDPRKPGDIERALSIAISMPLKERQERWEPMMSKLKDHSIQEWSANFVRALERNRRVAERFNKPDAGAPSSSKRRKLGEELAESSSQLELSPKPPSAATGYLVLPKVYAKIDGFDFDHGPQRASDVVIGALNAHNLVPTQVQPRTDLYIHGHLYTALLTKRAREPTPNNPLGDDVILIPRLQGG
ncbi:trehalose-6-phosphate synthase [Bradyrhizobium sp. BRP22]|nr:trehalose-6-phosphate synthase [Bradyrhizobium sp. BRP22]